MFKKVTVEQIHAEFDSAQERILQECNKILSSLEIPKEEKLENKAQKLIELGFENSEPVKQAKSLWQKKEKIEQQIDLTRQQAEKLKYFIQKYPFEKFITVDEFEKICNKYNLVHAPVKNYIKDVPEKNVIEMQNVKQLENDEKAESLYIAYEVRFRHIQRLEALWFETNIGLGKPLKFDDFIVEHGVYKTPHGYLHLDNIQKINREGLFIAAPKSHFNLEGLEKKSKFGLFQTETFEVKDPVVFEYCKNNIIRIITKWGTDDDKSYLDETLINSKLN